MENFNFVPEWDIMLMYHVIQDIPLNLPAVMMWQIKEAASQVKTYLPCGMALIPIFKNIGVSLEGENSRVLMYLDSYNK